MITHYNLVDSNNGVLANFRTEKNSTITKATNRIVLNFLTQEKDIRTKRVFYEAVD